MNRAVSRSYVTAAVAIAAMCASYPTLAQAVTRPSDAEIHDIEAKLTMPHGAASILEYVRYYYASVSKRGRYVTGVYVARTNFEPPDVPSSDVVVVSSDAEVPAPYDAGCDVVWVTYDPDAASILSSYCSSELKLWDD
jgi:hypothetical protein